MCVCSVFEPKNGMSKRVNIVLPDETLRVLDRVAGKGDRSRFISEAVLHYVRSRGAANLRERLKHGALANAKLNLRAYRSCQRTAEVLQRVQAADG